MADRNENSVLKALKDEAEWLVGQLAGYGQTPLPKTLDLLKQADAALALPHTGQPQGGPDCWAPWRALADAPVVHTKAHLKSTKLFLGSKYGSIGDAREIFQGDGFGNQCVAVAINGDVAERLVRAVNRELQEGCAETGCLKDGLSQALRQWRMYAEHEPDRDLRQDTDAEAVLYRNLCELLRLSCTAGEATAADMQAFSASEACCYLWPEDTDEHKALRAAYIKGAASVNTAGQEWREPEGWQLVPKELTEDMAAEIECSNGTDEGWQRALAACPPLPAPPVAEPIVAGKSHD